MRNKFLLLFLIIVLFNSALLSQNQYDLPQFNDESFRFIKQPLKWEENDWLKLGLFSASTFLLMQADKPVQDAVLKDRSYNNSFPIKAGRLWGDVYPTAFFAGAFALHGLIANDQSSKKISYEIVQTTLYAGAITTFLKFAIGRARPFTDRGSGTLRPFTIFDDDFHSMPSGHATLAFSLSTVLSKNAKSDFLKVIAYLPAVLTAFSRIYQNDHWTSDVFLGAAIGYFVGDWVTRQHEENDSPVQTASIFPLIIRIKL
ncbi:MAG: phosphatase PAP2 family protein [Ignavibacteriales bacterium]|nr:phosphatase PAP2 family protein [Ignavibacteriales bacterium]